jgi:predicted aspartyl protease
MIRGTVTYRRQAIVRLRVRGPTGLESDIDAVVDTGFNSALTLPDALITSLKLVEKSKGQGTLANGSVHHFVSYEAELLWDGQWRRVLVSGSGTIALLGMRLVMGRKLLIEGKVGGTVELVLLP